MGYDAKDGQLDAARIPELTTHFGFDKVKPAVNRTNANNDNRNDETSDEMTDVQQSLSWSRQRRLKALKDFAKHGHHLNQQEDCDQHGDNAYHGRIHHRRFDFLAEAGSIFEVDRQSGEDFSQQAAFFSRSHHANV